MNSGTTMTLAQVLQRARDCLTDMSVGTRFKTAVVRRASMPEGASKSGKKRKAGNVPLKTIDAFVDPNGKKLARLPNSVFDKMTNADKEAWKVGGSDGTLTDSVLLSRVAGILKEKKIPTVTEGPKPKKPK
eukprot:3551772-Ditylum_brightwellii.AAC.1